MLLETSGSVDISKVNPAVIKIMDLKCPSSGECDRNVYANLDRLRPHDEIKFVIGSREDYLWAKNTLEQYRLAERFKVFTVHGLRSIATRAKPWNGCLKTT